MTLTLTLVLKIAFFGLCCTGGIVFHKHMFSFFFKTSDYQWGRLHLGNKKRYNKRHWKVFMRFNESSWNGYHGNKSHRQGNRYAVRTTIRIQVPSQENVRDFYLLLLLL